MALELRRVALGEALGPGERGPSLVGACLQSFDNVTNTWTVLVKLNNSAGALAATARPAATILSSLPLSRLRAPLPLRAGLFLNATRGCSDCCGPKGNAGMFHVSMASSSGSEQWVSNATMTVVGGGNVLVTAAMGNLEPSLVDGHGSVRQTKQQIFGLRYATGNLPQCAVLNAAGIPLAPFNAITIAPACRLPAASLLEEAAPPPPPLKTEDGAAAGGGGRTWARAGQGLGSFIPEADDAAAPPLSCGGGASPQLCTPQGLYTARGTVRDGVNLPRVLYAEHFGAETDDWGTRINLAIQASFVGGGATIIELPVGLLNISVPVKLWRLRRSAHADTTASNVSEFADIGAVWEAVKGGEPSDAARGFHLRGVAGGGYASATLSTRLRWTGANNSVMLDMPAPWHCRVSDLMLDGGGTAGLIGIRYRAGYEFGLNGGKINTFERLSIFAMHVGIEVGVEFGLWSFQKEK
jgi:hypothetical protein